MALDPIIHKHLDAIDAVKDRVDEDIDKAMAGIDIDALLKDPRSELLLAMAFVQRRLVDVHIPEALKEGVALSKDIKKDGDVVVQDSTNPNLNKEQLDGDS